jgi:bacteriocin biosynthesis cyclodehydratase domain-containing protein
VLLTSDLVSVRLDGGFAPVLADTILPLLDGRHPLGQVLAAVPEVPAGDLREHLDALVAKGVLRREAGAGEADGDQERVGPFDRFLDATGVRAAGRAVLSGSQVAVFGVEAHGAHAAAALAAAGVGSLVLVDPYPVEWGNLHMVPGLGPGAVGTPRAQALRSALADQWPSVGVTAAGGDVSADGVDDLVADSDLVIGSFDRAFGAVNQWINVASLAHQVPALYGELRGASAFVGPLVIPGETACYLCWRMRAIACEADFEAAMSYEEFLDERRHPALHSRAVLPGLPSYVGGLLAVEALKHLLGLDPRSLAGRVHEFDALTSGVGVHTVLAVADCPACKKKSPIERIVPSLS